MYVCMYIPKRTEEPPLEERLREAVAVGDHPPYPRPIPFLPKPLVDMGGPER